MSIMQTDWVIYLYAVLKFCTFLSLIGREEANLYANCLTCGNMCETVMQ